MCFDLQKVLDSSEGFHLEDSGNFNNVDENKVADDFTEIKKIIKDWGNDIFQEDIFATPEGFEKIKRMKIKKLKCGADDLLSENMVIAATNLHRITYQGLHDITFKGLKVDKKLSKSYLQQIHDIFSEFAETLPECLEKSKNQIIQLSLYPNLVSKCSEEFLKGIADKLGNRAEFFNIKNVLKDLKSVPDVYNAIEGLSENFFIKKACYKKEYNLIQNALAAPLLKRSSFQKAFEDTASHLMAILIKAVNEGRDVNEDDIAKMKASIQSLKQHFINLKITHDLSQEKTSSKKNLDDSELKLKEYQVESQKEISLLKEKYSQAKLEYKEALNGSLHYTTLSNALKEIIELREKTSVDAERRLELAQKESEEKIAQLKTTVAESKNRYNDALLKAKNSPVYENIALDLDPGIISDLQIISENISHLVICYKKYISFAKEKIANEVEPKGWLSYFW